MRTIDRRIDALVREKPELEGALTFYRALLPALHAHQANVPSFQIDAETAQRKLSLGKPLLVGEDLPLDVEAAQSLFLDQCRLVETQPDNQLPSGGKPEAPPGHTKSRSVRASLLTMHERTGHPEAARTIRTFIERGELDLAAVWSAVAAGRRQEIEFLADTSRLDLGLLTMLAEFSLIPSIRVWAQGIDSLVDLDLWRRGWCPVCGSQPIFSEMQGKEAARRLRCGMCGASWFYPRLQCAVCQSDDYRSIGIIRVDGEEEKYRLQTCDLCQGYIKIVITFEPTPFDLLAVEDLATLHLDLIADERGFSRTPVR